jgi:DNA-binding transcriptional LysR family regulator
MSTIISGYDLVASTELSRVDLNLLVALDVLLEERNVTRASERLFITQPAMSKTLQRLRILFDDELFIRSGRELLPTARARELEAELPTLMSQIESVVSGKTFDPAKDAGDAHIATPEFMAVQIVPKLTWELAGEAPNFTLAISNKLENYQKYLRNGELDFVLAVDATLPDEFVVTPVGGFSPAVWMRKGHPLAGEELTLANLLQYPFIQYFLLQAAEKKVSTAAESRFDKTIADMGLTRRKVIITDQLMTALSALQTSDCLMLSTEDDLKIEAGKFEIVRKPYPREIEHDSFIPVSLFQHRKTIQSSMHNWLKERLIRAITEVKTDHGTLRLK